MHDEHKSAEKFNDICELKHQILHFIMGQVSDGFEADPTKVAVLGEYVDMIKDLAQAEKECQEACYYESVVKAMDDYDMPMGGRMGYNPNRNRKGQYSDGLAGNRTGDDRSSWGDDGMGRRGYAPEVYTRMMQDGMWDKENEMDGWSDEDDEDNRRFGKSFGKYRRSKRHYTRTHSEEDKAKMKEHSNEYLTDTMAGLSELWDSADPEFRKRMKTNLTNLTAGMTV